MGTSIGTASDTSGEFPERIRFAQVTPKFLAVFGVAPALGRGFTNQEFALDESTAVLYSDRFWRRRFGADPAVVGSSIRVESTSYDTVGVMPAGFRFLERDVDSWSTTPVDAPYWTSSMKSASEAWTVNFANGETSSQSIASSAYVRCVRFQP